MAHSHWDNALGGRGVFYKRAMEEGWSGHRGILRDRAVPWGKYQQGWARSRDQRKSEGGGGVLEVTRRKSFVLRKTVTSVQGHSHPEATPLSSAGAPEWPTQQQTTEQADTLLGSLQGDFPLYPWRRMESGSRGCMEDTGCGSHCLL